jgi:predicted house-cleaning noncanonical NTP pyrophosphatase (MazG superfamily)
VKELIISIRQAMGIRAGALEEMRRKKAKDRGRFKEKIFLETVE